LLVVKNPRDRRAPLDLASKWLKLAGDDPRTLREEAMYKKVAVICFLLIGSISFGFSEQQDEVNEALKEILKSLQQSIKSAPPPDPALAKAMIEALQKFRAGLPPEEQQSLDTVSADLIKKPDEVLYRLSWSTDICASKLLDCHGLPNDKIKPVIAGMLEYKKRVEAIAQERRNLWISLGGLGISFCSLVLSILAFFRKGRGSVARKVESAA
jgi:hypothetical protein